MGAAYGRTREVEVLTRACSDAASGSGRSVLLTGEAGIGKSLLAEAVGDVAADLGLDVARGWCVDDPAAPPLWPWRRAARGLPRLAAALDTTGAGADDTYLWRLTAAVADVLGSTPAGTCVVLEDLHWADPLTLDLLRRLLPEVERVPVLLVGTARDDPAGRTPYGRTVPALLRAPGVVHLPLAGLPTEAVRAWLTAEPPPAAGWRTPATSSPGPAATPSTCARWSRRSEGPTPTSEPR